MIFSFGGSLIFFALSFQFLLPASLDMHTDCEGEDDEEEDSEEEIPGEVKIAGKVSKFELVMHSNYLFALITMGFGSFSTCFFYPMLPLMLMHVFGLSQSQAGFFFIIAPFFAIISANTLALKVQDWMTNRHIMITGLFCASVGCFFMGPS